MQVYTKFIKKAQRIEPSSHQIPTSYEKDTLYIDDDIK